MGKCELVWAAPDYVRCVYVGSEVRGVGGAEGLWLAALGAGGIRFANDKARKWGYAGFRGWSVGGTGVAEDVNGDVLVQVAGGAAGAYIDAVGLPERITRLDVQATFKPPCEPNEWLYEEWEWYKHRSQYWPYKGRAPKVRAIEADDVTVYSGRRSRDGVMLREYNSEAVHGAESSLYAGTVRLELECTGTAARRVFRQIGGREWKEEMVASVVLGTARRRGSQVDYVSRETGYARGDRRERNRDVERTLEWLRRQVAPALRRLEKEGATSESVLAALFGLSDV